MRKYLILLCVLALICGTVVYARMNVGILGGSVPAAGGGLACSGDFSNGATEDFESGLDAFCTTDWTESEGDGASGVIDTYSTSGYHCGTHSTAITWDSDTAAQEYIQADYGSEITDVYIRFYFTTPDIADWSNTEVFTCGVAATTGTFETVYLKFQDKSTEGTTAQLALSGTEDAANYYELTEGAKYRIEIHAVTNSTSTIRVYDSAGAAFNHNGAAAETTVTTPNNNIRYFAFIDESGSAVAATGYIDDVAISTTGWVGAQSCE